MVGFQPLNLAVIDAFVILYSCLSLFQLIFEHILLLFGSSFHLLTLSLDPHNVIILLADLICMILLDYDYLLVQFLNLIILGDHQPLKLLNLILSYQVRLIFAFVIFLMDFCSYLQSLVHLFYLSLPLER